MKQKTQENRLNLKLPGFERQRRLIKRKIQIILVKFIKIISPLFTKEES